MVRTWGSVNVSAVNAFAVCVKARVLKLTLWHRNQTKHNTYFETHKRKNLPKKIQLRITHQVICPSDGLSWPWSDNISVPNSSFSPLRGGSGARLARGQSEGHLERCPGYEPCARDTSLVPGIRALSPRRRAFLCRPGLLILQDICTYS